MTIGTMGCYAPCGAPVCERYGCVARRREPDLWVVPPQQQGCICPPTSEQTCLNDRCPRKPWKPYTVTTTTEPKHD